MQEYKGKKLTIRHCEESPENEPTPSWNEALEHIDTHKQNTCYAQMKARRDQLADVGVIRNREHFNDEGKLPNNSKFYAIKLCTKVRAYGWFSKKHKSVFYISHYAYKNQKKLSKLDTDKVISNWRTIEEN